MPYDDGRFQVSQTLPLDNFTAQTSVNASQAELARHTFMTAVEVTDWNVRVMTGDTQTSGFTALSINKSAAGTGALAAFGTANLGTNADNTVIDGTVTTTSFSAGDDLVIAYDAGTSLPANAFKVGFDVMYKEKFAGG